MTASSAPRKRPSWVVVIPSRLVVHPPALPDIPPARRAALHHGTMVSFVACLGAGLALYTIKHHTAQTAREIAQTLRATAALQQQTGALQAEWAGLNDPDRLRQLAVRYLALRKIDPTQYAQIGDLPRRVEHPVALPAAPEVPQPPADHAPRTAGSAAGACAPGACAPGACAQGATTPAADGAGTAEKAAGPACPGDAWCHAGARRTPARACVSSCRHRDVGPAPYFELAGGG